MPDDNLNIDLQKIVQNAIGEKPFNVQGNFNNVMAQKAADIISGKRDDIASHYSMTQDSVTDDELEVDPTEDELDDILDDDEDDIELDDDEEEDQAEQDTEEELDGEES